MTDAGAETPVRRKVRHPILAVLLGLLLICLLTPVSQLFTIAAVNASIETATPIGWAVGFVTCLVLAGGVFYLLAKRRLASPQTLLVLYAMLTIAVPTMNLGLVRPLVLAQFSVVREYIYEGTSTYRTAYSALEDDWQPVIPTAAGLAWNQADRLLRFLEDGEALAASDAAERELILALGDPAAAADLTALAREDPDHPELQRLRSLIPALGADAANRLLSTLPPDALAATGLATPLAAQRNETAIASAEARDALPELLAGIDEYAVSLLPANFAAMDISSQRRIEQSLARLTPEEEAALEERVARAEARVDELRRLATALGTADRNAVRNELRQQKLARYKEMSEPAFRSLREDFVFRLTRDERRRLMQQDGGNRPDQDLWSFRHGVFDDVAAQQRRDRQTFGQNVRDVIAAVPWHLWAVPLMLWGLLLSSFFLFLLCLAEWLRRKWVDRENLTFPVVEVIDNLLRHDRALEQAADVRDPPKRTSVVSRVFLLGAGIAVVVISLEALQHYRLLAQGVTFTLNISETIFKPAGGMIANLHTTIFVLSPLVVGLLFLVSLEVSFSIWVSYGLFLLVSWWVKMGNPEIRDSDFTGFNAAKNYPWVMEQMLGAMFAFALLFLWKSFRTPTGNPVTPENGAYVSPLLTRIGLAVLPVVIVVLMWMQGIHHLGLIIVALLILIITAVAMARLRAETGLPVHHASYEFTKVPLILGMTEATGAKTFTAYLNVVFLPMTLLFRSLGVQLENIELARRHRVSYGLVAVASLLAFVTALGVGSFCFVVFSYFYGEYFYAGGQVLPPQGSPHAVGLATYPLWVSHFLGEPGLDNFNQINWTRINTFAIAFLVVALLFFLRRRFLRFPLHPLGYPLILGSVYFSWATPYYTTTDSQMRAETSLLWGSAFIAWLLKSLIVKYGGMNAYKGAKPFFIGLVAGTALAVFGWNVLDLICSFWAAQAEDPPGFVKLFTEVAPYSPFVY